VGRPTRVVFSHGKDADQVIKNLVDACSTPREAVVVTDDRAIQRWVRGVGAKIMGVRDFLSAGAGPARTRSSPSIDPADRETITRELWGLWKPK
jgi:hypothetical protein